MNQFRYELADAVITGKLSYSKKAGWALEYTSEEPLLSKLPAQAELGVAKTLTISFAKDSGRLLYIDGYCPIDSWQAGQVQPPNSKKGKVYVELDEDPPVGVTTPIDGLDDEILVFDANSGWVRIGTNDADEHIEIASDIVMGVSQNKLMSIWLHPNIDSGDR